MQHGARDGFERGGAESDAPSDLCAFGFGYNLAGVLTSETYPSGLSGTLAGQGKNYVSEVTYWPHGAGMMRSGTAG